MARNKKLAEPTGEEVSLEATRPEDPAVNEENGSVGSQRTLASETSGEQDRNTAAKRSAESTGGKKNAGDGVRSGRTGDKEPDSAARGSNNDQEVKEATVIADNPLKDAEKIRNPGWITTDLIERLQTVIVRAHSPDKGRYYINKVAPKETVFGGRDGRMLYYKGKPLSVFFAARLVSTFYEYGRDRLPARCPAIKFRFIRDVDEEAARALVYAKAKPQTETEKTTFWCGYKATYWDKSIHDKEVKVFKEIYDGTEEVRRKALMKRLTWERLANNDLLLIECQVQRYVRGGRKTTWTNWNTSFKLVSVTKVSSPPEDAEPEEESMDEAEYREDTDDDEKGGY
ncbi:hypothetical protein NM688_g5732 [Phlebia brevispora]|uniref:Uncharacterized protein n=1 Tax=Phlebia brevispora TaxID=194682 RepID=A0ACC1SR56_9APHY|nr:hypothetical protein NM688_g5732 [Phlebia brevispora]